MTPTLPVLTDDELRQRFAKIKPVMTDVEAAVESSRCLFCHDAPCTAACPSSIDIPMFIRQIMSRNTKGAAKTIFTQNILGKSCGDVCPTEVLCEGACVYNDMNKAPIEIGRLQSFATTRAIATNTRFFTTGAPTGRRVAVVGGGPAGLACAHELTVLGHEAVVFEASEKPGGLNTYGVAPYKLSNRDAIQEIEYISKIGFEVKTKHRVEPSALPDLERTYDAIFLGVGLGSSHSLGIPGEDKDGVVGASTFIYELRRHEQRVRVGKRVIVVGAGNTAVDAAVESAKLGSQVTIVYRRQEADQSAYDFEVEFAKQHGVQFLYLTSPLEVLGDRVVTGLRCVKNEAMRSSGNKKPDIRAIAGSEFTLPCDMVILATGQEKMREFFQAIPRLELEGGRVKVKSNFQTTNEKYFAGGDAVNGGKEVVNAVAHGRDAARGIDRYLKRAREL